MTAPEASPKPDFAPQGSPRIIWLTVFGRGVRQNAY
jgi:hypothetical protein